MENVMEFVKIVISWIFDTKSLSEQINMEVSSAYLES